MKRRDFLAVGVAGSTTLMDFLAKVAHAKFGPGISGDADGRDGEELYNGIRLPAAWPPEGRTFSFEPMHVP